MSSCITVHIAALTQADTQTLNTRVLLQHAKRGVRSPYKGSPQQTSSPAHKKECTEETSGEIEPCRLFKENKKKQLSATTKSKPIRNHVPTSPCWSNTDRVLVKSKVASKPLQRRANGSDKLAAKSTKPVSKSIKSYFARKPKDSEASSVSPIHAPASPKAERRDDLTDLFDMMSPGC